MFCWAEAENSIKMRGGKNLPLAQSRRSRCSGSLPLACLLHQNWSPWNMTVPKKTKKDTKHSWKKSNSKYKPHWFLKREEKIQKSRFLKKWTINPKFFLPCLFPKKWSQVEIPNYVNWGTWLVFQLFGCKSAFNLWSRSMIDLILITFISKEVLVHKLLGQGLCGHH